MTVACYQLSEHEFYRSIWELSEADAAALIAPVRLMLAEAGASTPLRIAHLLAQVAHESGGLRLLHEVWGPTKAQLGYERPTLADGTLAPLASPPEHISTWQVLGNTQPGDGPRYKGRGWVQLTGRGNYVRAGAALGLPLEADPEMAARVEVAARVAAWYWRTHGCNDLADKDDLEGIARRINGGLNGLDARRRRLEHAKKALGVP